jgi:hypothetical protein
MPTNTLKGPSEFGVGIETQSSISVQEGQPAPYRVEIIDESVAIEDFATHAMPKLSPTSTAAHDCPMES